MSTHSIATTRERRAREEYRLGLVFFQRRQWSAAARHFHAAQRLCHRDDLGLRLYTSWQGLALVCCGDGSGLNLCRNVAAAERLDATVFLNLAVAELRLGHRRQAVVAVARGLSMDPDHAGLRRLREDMGERRRPALPFLPRNNPLNRWLGRLSYRKAAAGTARTGVPGNGPETCLSG